MKTQKHILTALAVLTFALTVALAACSPAASPGPQDQPGTGGAQDPSGSPVLSTPVIDMTTVDDQGNTSVDSGSLQSNLSVSGELSDEEISGLLYIREEEKLAHDVYVALYEKWGLTIFQNIASSEQSHTDAVKAVLDAYGLPDPAAGKTPGEFVNADLQALYDDLTAQGSQSLSDALKVGAAIEEIDILDLEKHLAQTENSDIRMVYENLMKGSRNHLRAFTSTLSRQAGETYQPQYLSADVYQSIVGSTIESGGNGNGNRP
jgi:hypothetical protein